MFQQYSYKPQDQANDALELKPFLRSAGPAAHGEQTATGLLEMFFRQDKLLSAPGNTS
jgi:hypothetical protein